MHTFGGISEICGLLDKCPRKLLSECRFTAFRSAHRLAGSQTAHLLFSPTTREARFPQDGCGISPLEGSSGATGIEKGQLKNGSQNAKPT
jgi:hypothetical protein